MTWTVREFLEDDGTSPFRSWLTTLDTKVRARIQARIFRFELGNLDDHKSVGGGVWEARLDFGPGYRLYFGKSGDTLLLLLLGGAKDTQGKDIRRAQRYWMEFLEDAKDGETK